MGISFQFNFKSVDFSILFLISSIFFTLLSFFVLKSNSIVFIFSTAFLFFSLGYKALNEIYFSPQKLAFEKKYIIGESYLFEIVDIGNENREWKKVIANVNVLKKEDHFLNCTKQAVFFINTKDSLEVGDIVATNSPLERIKNKGNPGEFDADFFWSSKGIDQIGFITEDGFSVIDNQISWFDKWSLKSRDYLISILKTQLKGEELAVAQALILGVRSDLETETINAFGNSGAMHVLAVSGLHIGILLEIILITLMLFSKYLSKKKALIIALIIIWIYTILSGLSASVLRSTVMFSVLSLSQLYGKNHHSINNLFFTAFVLLVINPLNLYDIGFQLSFLAMLGIFWFYQPISKWIFVKNKWVRKIWETTAVGLAAQLLTVPLTLYYFHQFPNYFLITNISLMSVTGIVLGFGLLVFSFYWLKFLGKLFVVILSFSLLFTLKTVHFIDEIPGSIAVGFLMSEWTVYISFIIVIGFYLLNEFKFIRVVLIFCSILLLAKIEYDRFQNMNKMELCFFNHNQLTFIVKNKNQSYCFYNAREEKIEKAKQVILAYSKIYPSTNHYFNIKKKNWHLKDKDFEIGVEKKKNGFSIRVNEKRFFVLNNNEPIEKENQVVYIDMPWVQKSNNELYLSEHSIRFNLD